MVQWAMGYLTAAEILKGMRHSRTDAPGVTAFLDKYCRDNPLTEYGIAVTALSIELYGKYVENLKGK